MSKYAAFMLLALVNSICSMLVLLGAGYWQVSITMSIVSGIPIWFAIDEAVKG